MSTRGPARPLRIAGWVFLGTFLIQCAWNLVIPPYAGIDEFDHVYRAAAVADGQWSPSGETTENSRGQLVVIDKSLVTAAHSACARLDYEKHDNCNPAVELSNGKVKVATAAATYNPVFYWILGTVAQPFGGAAADYAMRLVASLLCSLAIALATWVTAQWARTVWPVVAIVLACTPTVLYSDSLPAPNGVEMICGLGVWCALLGATGGDEQLRARFLYLAAVFVVPMAFVRGLGSLWLALTAVVFVVLLGPVEVWRIVRSRPVAATTFLSTGMLAAVAGAFWTAHTASLHLETIGHFSHAFTKTLPAIPLWFFQMLAAFPFRNQAAPPVVYGTGLLAISAFVVAGFLAARATVRTALVVTLLLVVVVSFAIEFHAYPTNGHVWQGRYPLPFAMGILVLTGAALDRRPPRQAPTYLLVGGVLWAIAHLASLVGTLHMLARESTTHPYTDWVVGSYPAVIALTLLGLAALAMPFVDRYLRTRRDVAVPSASTSPALR